MYNDRLNGLLALKAVADTRNFTAAARLLGVSPPAVSQTIKLLERRLGVALLSRTTRSTSLTEAGESFLGQAGPALDQILTALENVGSYAEKPAGLLRLNLPRQIYPSYLAPLLAQLTGQTLSSVRDYGPWLQQQGFHVLPGGFGRYQWTADARERDEDIARFRELMFDRDVPVAIRRLPASVGSSG